jgi:hypothetical protein
MPCELWKGAGKPLIVGQYSENSDSAHRRMGVIMTFRRSDLQEAFFVPGTHAFRVWGYGTTDPLEEVLREDYFAVARGLLRPGELIYVSTAPQQTGPGVPARGEARLALVMVRADERGAASVRLVQDFGRPGDPSGAPSSPVPPGPEVAPAPPKRGRGRPPGSRTRKPA